MKKILKLIPGLTFIADSINALIIIFKYSIGVNVQIEEERADPDDPKWENNPWAKVFEKRCAYALSYCHSKRVLDLCCGTGWTANELSKVAVSVKAVDYSKDSIDNARRRFPKGNLLFEEMNALSLSYADESFDTVISMEAIEHFSKSDGEIFINEVYRVLKKGGSFVGSTPQVETKNPLKIMAMKKIDPFHLHLYSSDMLKSLLSKYFNNVTIESQPEEWMLFKCSK